jgi:hypothetical protein
MQWMSTETESSSRALIEVVVCLSISLGIDALFVVRL